MLRVAYLSGAYRAKARTDWGIASVGIASRASAMMETSREWTASGVYGNDRFGTAGAAAGMDEISPAASQR